MATSPYDYASQYASDPTMYPNAPNSDLIQRMQQQYGAAPSWAMPTGEDVGNPGKFLGFSNNTNYFSPTGTDMGKITYGDPWELAKAAGFLGSFALGGSALGALAGGTGGMFGAAAAGGAGAGAGTAAGTTAGTDIFGGTGMATGFTDAGTAGGALDAGYAGAGAAAAGGVGAAADGAGGINLAEGPYPSSVTAGDTAASGSNVWSNSLVQKALTGGVTSLLGGTAGGSQQSTNSGFGSLGGIAGLLSGIYGANQQSKAGSDLLNYLKSRQSINDTMYAPNSPEYNALWNEMSRKDAAAGRNSQYGPRSVDLASRIAQLKMNANTQMTTGISKYINDGLTQKANAGANVTSMLPGLLGNGSGSLLQLIQQLGNSGSSTNYSDPSTWNLNDATPSPGTGYDTSGGNYIPFEGDWIP